MRQANTAEPNANHGIAGTEADGLLHQWDSFLQRTRVKLALAEIDLSVEPVAIEVDRHFVFGYGFVEPVLRAQYRAFGVMRKRAARQLCHRFYDQLFRLCDIRRGRVGQSVGSRAHAPTSSAPFTDFGSSCSARSNSCIVSIRLSRVGSFINAARPRRMYSIASGCSVGRAASATTNSRLSATAIRLVMSFCKREQVARVAVEPL